MGSLRRFNLKWSPEKENALLRARKQGHSYWYIAHIFGMQYSVLALRIKVCRLKKQGVKARRVRKNEFTWF